MPKVEVKFPEPDRPGPYASYGTQLIVDGRELTEVRELHISAVVGEPVLVRADVFPTEGMHFETDASLTVNIIALPGYEVVKEVGAGGREFYTCQQRTPPVDRIPGPPPPPTDSDTGRVIRDIGSIFRETRHEAKSALKTALGLSE